MRNDRRGRRFAVLWTCRALVVALAALLPVLLAPRVFAIPDILRGEAGVKIASVFGSLVVTPQRDSAGALDLRAGNAHYNHHDDSDHSDRSFHRCAVQSAGHVDHRQHRHPGLERQGRRDL